MKKLYVAIRYFAYLIEIIVFYIIERIPVNTIIFNNVKPIILLPIVVMISLFEGAKVGIFFGFIAGLFLDLGYNGNIGFYTATLSCISIIVGTIAQKIIKFNLIISVFISIIFTACLYLSHFIVNYLIYGYSDLLYTLQHHYLNGFLFTSLLSPFMYFFTKAFAVNIKAKK